MVVDKTGSLSGVRRHDYLPYGEELYAGMGGRTTQQGYVADSMRQKFTGYEHDAETGLEFAQARYYSSSCGRFTSPDPFAGSMSLTDPQTFNRYSYVSNNPVNSTDPSGMSQRPAMVGGGMDGGGISEMFRSSSDDYTDEGRAEYEKDLEETSKNIKEGEQIGAAGKSTGPAAPAAPQNTGNMPTPCDQQVAATFGSDGAVGRTSIDYNGIYRGYDPAAEARLKGSKRIGMGNPLYDSEHLYWFPHLSGNQAGTENTDIFVLGNYQGRPTGPTRGDHVVTFYYPQFFGMKNVTLAVFHVGDFSLQRVGDRVRIGRTGGPGGDSGGPSPNRHAHFELWRGNTGFLPPGPGRDAVRIPLTPIICGH